MKIKFKDFPSVQAVIVIITPKLHFPPSALIYSFFSFTLGFEPPHNVIQVPEYGKLLL